MKKALSKFKFGILLLVLCAVCTKVTAKWYDLSSKLSIFATDNHDSSGS